jgi:predicted ribosome quality control (RQC) complex YloA/Tae2 family protein
VHNNYYFLRQLTQSLEKVVMPAVVSECFSQNKDELIIRFERKESPFFIKASLSPSFSCLAFPENFHRARKNSIDLFEKLIGQRVERIHQYENERSFSIGFSNNVTLLFKMHGNRSNLILFVNNSIAEIFKNNIAEDEGIDLNRLDRPIDWGFENFQQHRASPEKIYFTFGKVVWKYLEANNYKNLSVDQQYQKIQKVCNQLQNPAYSIRKADGHLFFSMLEYGEVVKAFDDPINAINTFFTYYTQQESFAREKTSMLSHLTAKLHATENYIGKTQKKLDDLDSDNNYKVWADILMANLHAIGPGLEKITLANFYHDNHPTEIKLKRDLSPQKNAAIFYKKSKNQQIEIHHLQQLLKNKRKELDDLAMQVLELESAHDFKTVKGLHEKLNLNPEKEKQATPLPYREVEFKGYKIWIGKNAQNNDTLTLKYGYKEDLWLHAKDVAGSHVLIKHQAGKNFPKDVIERAAQLAAYYSKRKNESLCPVAVTPKKFVRKRKGDPAGAVVVEREEVLMVVPSLNGDR